MTENSEHRWTVDGIEEGMARIEEDGARMIVVPRYLLPAGVKEGQVLRVTRAEGPGGGAKGTSVALTVQLDAEATARARARSAETVARASAQSRRRDPGGDVAL